MRLTLLLLSLLLLTVNTQATQGQAPTASATHNLTEIDHIEGYPYVQECPIPPSNSSSPSRTFSDQLYENIFPWMHPLVSLTGFMSLLQYYREDKTCFTVTIILIQGQIQMGLLLLSISSFRSSQLVTFIYLFLIIGGSLFAFAKVFLSENTKRKQQIIFLIFVSSSCVTGLWFMQYYERFHIYLFIFSPLIHIYNLMDRKKKINIMTINLTAFSTYNFNSMILSTLLNKYPQLFVNKFTQAQITPIIDFTAFIGLFFALFIMLPVIKEFFVEQSRWVINKLKGKMGIKLEEETCIICLQPMDHFASLFQTLNFHCGKDTDIFQNQCGHLFHQRCLFNWALIKGKCPIDNCTLSI